MRVLHLPSAVGGNAYGLSRAERRLGLKSDCLVHNGLFYPDLDFEYDLGLQDSDSGWRKFHRNLRAFLAVRGRYDVFHFNFGRSLMEMPSFGIPLLDLPFYPRGVPLFATYNGCDARQRYTVIRDRKIAACHEEGCGGGVCRAPSWDQRKALRIQKMARYVRHIWSLNPDLMSFLPKEQCSFLPYTIAHPDPGLAPPSFTYPLRILHAPSDRGLKGSRYILEAFAMVKERYGEKVVFDLVEGVPHEVLIQRLRPVDLVVDQVLIGWYGALAVEAMVMGKPVVARIEREDLGHLPAGMDEDVLSSVIDADPFTLVQVLSRCIEEPGFLRERATASLRYARKWHDPLLVAGLTKAAYLEFNDLSG